MENSPGGSGKGWGSNRERGVEDDQDEDDQDEDDQDEDGQDEEKVNKVNDFCMKI